MKKKVILEIDPDLLRESIKKTNVEVLRTNFYDLIFYLATPHPSINMKGLGPVEKYGIDIVGMEIK